MDTGAKNTFVIAMLCSFKLESARVYTFLLAPMHFKDLQLSFASLSHMTPVPAHLARNLGSNYELKKATMDDPIWNAIDL